jgi:hypothetical protein
MVRATVMAMANGNVTETMAAMVNGNHNGNGQQQQRRRWATTSATATDLAMAIAMATATVRATMTKGGLPLHVPAMCSTVAGRHLPPPHGHKGKCIHQCCVMGGTLLRVFPPFQGGGFLTDHHGLFFCLFLQLLFSLLNNPLFAPRIIQALKNPVNPLMLCLLHSSKNPVSLLMIYPSSYCTFCQGKQGQGLQ